MPTHVTRSTAVLMTVPPPAPIATLLVYLVLIVVAAFTAGSSVTFLSLTHRQMQVLLSLTGGVLLGVGLLHLLPHASLELGGPEHAVGWVLLGFFVMFLLERAFHGHAHHGAAGDTHAEHHGSCPGGHGHATAATTGRWAWLGAFAGLSLHSLADGAALAASVDAEAAHGAWPFAGFATFLAILLHKPFDAGIIAALMMNAGISRRARLAVNTAYALIVPLGAAMLVASLGVVGGNNPTVLGIAMALAAGAFICIAAADLLPEVQFHSHDRVLLTVSLAIGLLLAWGIAVVERSSHAHAARPGTHGHAR